MTSAAGLVGSGMAHLRETEGEGCVSRKGASSQGCKERPASVGEDACTADPFSERLHSPKCCNRHPQSFANSKDVIGLLAQSRPAVFGCTIPHSYSTW